MARAQGRIAVLWLLSLAAGIASAQEWPHDPNADPCDAGSARGQAECAWRGLRKSEADLRRTEDALRAAFLAQGEQEAARLLDQAQASWRRERDDTCAVEGALRGGGGSWPSAHNLYCQLRRTRERDQQVGAWLRCKTADDQCPGD